MVFQRFKSRKISRPLNKNSRVFLFLTIILSLLGLFFVFDASTVESYRAFGHQYHFLKQQSIWLVVGSIALVFGLNWPLNFWEKTAFSWYVFGIFLLILVFIPGLSLELNGAKRWIDLGFATLQPIEFFKFGLVLFFASWMHKHQKIGSFVFFTGLPALLLLFQPDLGSLLILLSIAFGMYFLAEGNLLTLTGIGLLGVALISLAIVFSPYRQKRLATFLNPESDPLGASFHIRQITLALGNGGLFGQGLGNSRQKYSYIPEASSDSIFAIVAEEIGFLGSLVLIGLFVAYVVYGYKIIKDIDKKSFMYLMGFGFLIWVCSQIILNLAAVVALVPLTGLPLPFFSSGGSSLVMVMFISGVMLNISKFSSKS
jgi:cell division protein FtsW